MAVALCTKSPDGIFAKFTDKCPFTPRFPLRLLRSSFTQNSPGVVSSLDKPPRFFLQTRKQLLERKYLNILKRIYLLEAKKNYKWQFSRTFLYFFFQNQQNIDFRILSSSKSKNIKNVKINRKI